MTKSRKGERSLIFGGLGVPIPTSLEPEALPQRGYVAVGTTLAPARRFDQTEVEVDGQRRRLLDLPLRASYVHTPGSDPDSDDMAEYAVPVRWIRAVPADQAYREPGMFASQHSACKLRQDFTLQKLAEHFDLDDEAT